MDLKSTRRIVTGHDAKGKAIVTFDASLQAKQRSPGGNGMTMVWATTEFPIDMSGSSDRSLNHTGVPPVTNGTVFRIVDFAPAAPHPAACCAASSDGCTDTPLAWCRRSAAG